jgi:transglutaminase-like putative cysteine protease
MPIRFRCPACKGLLACTDKNAGQVVACPGCNRKIQVPGPPGGQRPRGRRRSAVWGVLAAGVAVALLGGAAVVGWALHSASHPQTVVARETGATPAPAVVARPDTAIRTAPVATERPPPKPPAGSGATERAQPPPPPRVEEPVRPPPAEPVAVEAIENHAVKAPPEAERTLAALAAYLAEPGRGDADKVRAVYRWVTDRIAYDAEGFFAGRRGDQSAAGVLKSRKAVCEGYANLVADLCDRMGVKVARVRGRARGVADNAAHAWNAVCCDGGWRLLDATWGAGYLNGREFKKDYARGLLFVSPDLLCLTHFPEDPTWQLRKPPRTAEEFAATPKFDRGFFSLNPSAAELDKAMRDPAFRALPTAFSHPGKNSISLLAAPLTRDLRAGVEYRFELRSGEYESLFVSNEDKLVRLEKQGDVFRATVNAKAGRLQVEGQMAGDNRRHAILRYAVE